MEKPVNLLHVLFFLLVVGVLVVSPNEIRGQATFHKPTPGTPGHCKRPYSPDSYGGNWVAINAQQWNTFGPDTWVDNGKKNLNPICNNKKIWVRSARNRNIVQRNVRVADSCGDCGRNNLDLSVKLFKKFNKGSENAPNGRIDVIWGWQ